MLSIQELEKIASQVRRDIIRMVHGASSGHPGGPLGSTDFLVALYFKIMKPDPGNFTMDGVGPTDHHRVLMGPGQGPEGVGQLVEFLAQNRH